MKEFPPCAWPDCTETTGDLRSKYCKPHRRAHRLQRSHERYIEGQKAKGLWPRTCERCKKQALSRYERRYCATCRDPARAEYLRNRELVIQAAIAGQVQTVLQYVNNEIDGMRLGMLEINAMRLQRLARILTSIRIHEVKRNKGSEIYKRVRGHDHKAA